MKPLKTTAFILVSNLILGLSVLCAAQEDAPGATQKLLDEIFREIDGMRHQNLEETDPTDPKYQAEFDRAKEFVPELIRILGNGSNESEKSQACAALDYLGQMFWAKTPSIIEPAKKRLLEYMATDATFPEISTSIIALSHIQPMSQETIMAIIEEMDVSSSQYAGFAALARALVYNETAERFLVDALRDTSDPDRNGLASLAMVYAKGQYGNAVINAILENLISDNLRVREGALSFISCCVAQNSELAELSKPYILKNFDLPPESEFKTVEEPRKLNSGDDFVVPRELELKTAVVLAAYNLCTALEGDKELLDKIVETALDEVESESTRMTAIGAMTGIAPESGKVHDAIDTLKQDSIKKIAEYATKTSKRLID